MSGNDERGFSADHQAKSMDFQYMALDGKFVLLTRAKLDYCDN
jgi:hypothetical protein